MKEALCRILPVPCNEHHTAVALIPRAPRLQQLLTSLVRTEQNLSKESKVNLMDPAYPTLLDLGDRVCSNHALGSHQTS